MGRVNVVIIGPGLVGSEFIRQLAAYGTKKSSLAYSFSVVAVTNSKRMLLGSGINGEVNLSTWDHDIAKSDSPSDLTKIATLAASKQPCVMVDCTSSDSVAALYPSWLKLGLHVVTPNKKGFSGPLALYDEIKKLSLPSAGVRSPLAFHESTVGAGLPILSTLNDLVNTGDEIVKIEGIFSGTLSYIFNNFSAPGLQGGKGFSEIVKEAKAQGYTEPDPRDDLNGMDVGRKVTILGRLAGLRLELDTLSIENIVPEPLRNIPSANEFMTKLPSFDAHFAALNEEAGKNGQVLRCVGVVDPNGKSGVYVNRQVFIGIGSDNIIAFTTKRFPNPLIIQGAGAGAAVTAFGMFSDLLRIAAISTYGQ
ncbi:Homoserine dehydrogenase [Blyttiomyces sp. JEL0837]|nr:Homoserine dehydrogenase [Blyttiomyces sp. JEL0837]